MNQFQRLSAVSKLSLEYMFQLMATIEEGKKAAAKEVALYAKQLSAEDVKNAKAHARRQVTLDNSRSPVL